MCGPKSARYMRLSIWKWTSSAELAWIPQPGRALSDIENQYMQSEIYMCYVVHVLFADRR